MPVKNQTTIVAIGASAGGLEAIQSFFKAMPVKTGLAFVVIQHLSPDYKSMMDELLSRHTKIKIEKVTDGMKILPDTIYLIPPRVNMSVYHGKLYLKELDHKKGLNLPIDVFFRSLASEMGKKAIGIVLSGTGSDGTMGVKAIKEVGGMVMVQDKESAKFDGMPGSSIATGLVDYILPPSDMPIELLNYIRHPFVEKDNSLAKQLENNLDTLSKILLVLRDYIGVDFSYYKENTIIRRLERRLSINRLNNLDQYLKLLVESNKEKDVLYRELLIGVTRFFRDKEAFDALSKKILPELLKDKSKTQIRLWSAGCSTGEEVYSLAIIISELLEKHSLAIEVKIFATDIDRHAIEFAGNGIYPDSIVADIPSELIAKYFHRRENSYQISETIRKMVVFASHNVLKDPPFSKIDLISCRNLFIYFKPEVQAKVLSMFYFSLNTDGYLLMGSSETIGEMQQAFMPVDTKNKIFKYVKGYRSKIINGLSLPKVTRIGDSDKDARSQYFPVNLKSDFISENVYNAFVPPSVIIDSNNILVTVINDVNKYLQFPSGKFTNDIYSLLTDELKVVVRSVIRSLKSKKKPVKFENIANVSGLDNLVITVEGRIFTDKKEEKDYYFLSFVTSDKIEKEELAEVYDYKGNFNEKLKDVERELQYTKENLQATVEELETSNEELQSSNEELIASNEELQSTNEELQSVNEELYTVNSEYQNKIEELIVLNNDVNNLLKNINVGTLYLDSRLCIRKFTPYITRLIKLRDTDVGRPITHLNLDYLTKEFTEKVQSVLETLIPEDFEMQTETHIWYYVKIMPYRNQDNAVDGIIVTITDVTKLKSTTLQKDLSVDRLRRAMDIGNIAWWEWDLETNQVVFDDKKATMIGYTVEEFPTDVYEICALMHPDDYDRVMGEMKSYLSGETNIYDVKYRIKRKDGAYSWYYDRGGIVECSGDGKPLKLAGMVLDISEIKEMEEKIKRDAYLLNIVLEESPLAKTIVDSNGNIVYVNKAAEEVLGISKEMIKNRMFDDYKWKILSVDGKEIAPQELPFSVIKSTLKPLENYKHYISKGKEKRLLNITGTPLFSTTGVFDGVSFVIERIE